MQSLLLGKHDTLHYFILWLETVMERPISSNFGSRHPIKYLMNGIKFKATYSRPCSARLFFTHHGAIEPTMPGIESTHSKYQSYGLTLMTPLIQGRRMLPTMLRLNVNASTMDSPDPRIRHWVSIRQTQKESQLLPVLQPLQFRTDLFRRLQRGDLR